MAPNVPTIELQGSRYDMGLQHGQAAKDKIYKNIETYTSFFQETAGLSWAQAKQRSATFIPTIQRLYPQILEELEGIAKGAQLEFEDILALNTRSEISLTNYENTPLNPQPPPEITDGCTAVAQLSCDKSTLILAQNWDWLEALQDGTVILDVHAPDGTKFYTLTEAGLVAKIGINSYGVGICINALRCGAFSASRLPTHLMARYVLEYGQDFDDTVEMSSKYGGACTFNMMAADTRGKFGNLEITPHGISVLRPLSDSPDVSDDNKAHLPGTGVSFVAHTNHVLTPPDKFPLGPIYDRPAPNSFSRLERMTELTKGDIQGNVAVSVEAVLSRLQDELGAPVSICRGLPVNARGMERMTTLASILIKMNTVTREIQGNVLIGRPCEDLLQRERWAF